MRFFVKHSKRTIARSRNGAILPPLANLTVTNPSLLIINPPPVHIQPLHGVAFSGSRRSATEGETEREKNKEKRERERAAAYSSHDCAVSRV